MERLRSVANRNQAAARANADAARRALDDLAARRPVPPAPLPRSLETPQPSPVMPPAARNAPATSGIDAWLDRRPH
jgi:hypothetical protein